MTKQFETLLSSFTTIEEVKAFIKGYQLKEEEQTTPDPIPTPLPVEPPPPPTITSTTYPPTYPSPAQMEYRQPPLFDQEKSRQTRSSSGLRGLRAQTLRLLYTGPCTIHSLATALSISGTPLTRVICQLRNQELVWHPKPNVVSLTTAGIAEAKYFVDHPNLKIRPKAKE